VTNFSALIIAPLLALSITSGSAVQTSGCDSGACPAVSTDEQAKRNGICWSYCGYEEYRCDDRGGLSDQEFFNLCLAECKTMCPANAFCGELPETPDHTLP
jgi:hypothetical protein